MSCNQSLCPFNVLLHLQQMNSIICGIVITPAAVILEIFHVLNLRVRSCPGSADENDKKEHTMRVPTTCGTAHVHASVAE
mmetsp:Transcript_12812/g.22990  ORF Transcript_12812/g.22990 Transcript_12812/m.22990 type:complete len:80 (-) Transcript_12812:56-295(-)